MKKHLKYIEESKRYKLFVAASRHHGEFVGKTPLQAARLAWKASQYKLEYGVARVK